MTSVKFFGVHILSDHNVPDSNPSDRVHVYSSYEEACSVVKEFNSARFKGFPTFEEAICFSLDGSTSGPGNPNVVSEGMPFKSLKRQDTFKFRKHIENYDLKSVEVLVWENPRYLIGIGDTPTIMQEGARYNALHIAAIFNSYKIADFILKTISSKMFIQRLYGTAGDSSYVQRPQIMVDRYLNTPDKALNETPLHFAARHGSLEVVQVLIQYPGLQLNVKNKHGQTPKDVTCQTFRSKIVNKPVDSKGVSWYTAEIHKLLDEPFFVPIWRSNENIIQPIIGKPFSPKSPPVCPLATSPISPVMEIKAVAGPMSFDDASNFHKTWKSPVKSIGYGVPHASKGVSLRSPLGGEKSYERIGRSLARKFHVSWKEYWPFLDKFADLTSCEGLKLLENYLRSIIDESSQKTESYFPNIKSPISDLCSAFAKFTIKSPVLQNNNIAQNGGIDPFLCIENLCTNAAVSILNSFKENFETGAPADENITVLIKKMKNLAVTVNRCLNDKAFQDFPFHKIHAKIALSILSNITQTEETWLRYVNSIFYLIDSTEIGDIVHCIFFSPSSSKVELENIVQIIKCINRRVITSLPMKVNGRNEPKNSTDWLTLTSCVCFDSNNNIVDGVCRKNKKVTDSKFGKTRNNIRKKILFEEDDLTDRKITAPGVEQVKSTTEVTNIPQNWDDFVKPLVNAVSDNDSESDDDIFITPCSSVSNSEDEMESAEEGPNIFIYNNRGTSMDNAVLEVISDIHIDPDVYPSIYRWKHFILLHNNLNRLSWPNPNYE